jgi:hypothetical protein
MVKHRTRKAQKPALSPGMNTQGALEFWFKALYEKLGWIILVKEKGGGYNIPIYKKNLRNLLESIEHLKREYKDPDRIHDLNVMASETKVLCDFVNKHL